MFFKELKTDGIQLMLFSLCNRYPKYIKMKPFFISTGALENPIFYISDQILITILFRYFRFSNENNM
jgi:hypothetical protein